VSPSPSPPSLLSDAPESGNRVGHYTLLRQIGTGGMGAVFEAVQDHPRRTVAVKVMRRGVSSPAGLRRFEFEAQTLARLRHPGIAQIFEAGSHEHDGQPLPYYAMEFISGARPITEYAAEKKLTTRQRLELFALVCDAMQHAHDKGVLHRDLKPQNIVIDGEGRPKVIDFGIARAVDSDQAPPTQQTHPDQLLGTLQYMSPEQMDLHPSELDARSDVYALGVILYELLCQRLPYDVTRSKLYDAARVIRDQQPKAPHTIAPELGRDVETILLRALHKDRVRRYQSARDLAEDIRRAIAGEPLLARRDSAAYVIGTRVRSAASRHRVGSVVLAALVGLVLGQVGGWMLDEGIDASQQFQRFSVLHLTPFPDAALRSVVMIRLSDLDQVADAAGVQPPKIPTKDLRWLRPVHGAILRKLADSGARAVAIDVFMPAASDFPAQDDALIAGVEQLARNGIAAVFGVDSWELTDGRPRLIPTLLSKVSWGALTLNSGPDELLRMHLARTNLNVPGFAVAALAATRAPGRQPQVQIDTRLWEVLVTPPGAAAPWRLRASELWTIGKPQPQMGIAADVRADLVVAMPPKQILDRSAVDAADVLRADEKQLRQWFAGKTVVLAVQVGDLDKHPYVDGRELYGSEFHAVAIDRLLSGRWVRPLPMVRVLGGHWSTRIPLELSVAALAAVAGVWSVRFGGSLGFLLRWSLPVLLVLAVVSGSLMLYRTTLVVYCPWAMVLIALMSFELSRLASRAAAGRLI
jgi:hypothetical protein